MMATWRPMLLGGLFKMIGTANVPLFEQNANKQRHSARDIERQAARAGIPYRWPSRFPMNTVLALRATLVARTLDPEKARVFTHRIFRAYWGEDRDIADPSVIAALAGEVGLDGQAIIEATSHPEIKDALKSETEAAKEAGVFGAPTFVVHLPNNERALYWGADRLEVAALAASGDARAI
jgi:2-hydroxychromene-2-carboxylate isomerase